MLAIQDFRHASQRDDETVSDFIRRIERHYRVAYGRDGLGAETRNALLHSQLQEGLKLELMKASSVSGAGTYQALCLAAKNEERRLAELRKRHFYKKSLPGHSQTTVAPSQSHKRGQGDRRPPPKDRGSGKSSLRCYNCNEVGHLSKDCKKPRTESKGRSEAKLPSNTRNSSTANTRQVVTTKPAEDPLDFLLSGSDDEAVKKVELRDEGSVPKCVSVLIQGVAATGLIDSGADITIMGGELFKRVAVAAKLKKRDLHKSDKTPKTYDQRTFTLDGRMMLTIEFDEKCLTTSVYLKMDSPDDLLLSEGVCRQLGIIQYHSEVRPVRESPKLEPSKPASSGTVPLVKVSLVRSVHLLPHQSIVAQVHCAQVNVSCLVEQSEAFSQETGMHLEPTLVESDRGGIASIVLSNTNGYSCHADAGEIVGVSHSVSVVEPGEEGTDGSDWPVCQPASILSVMSQSERVSLLRETVGKPDLLDTEQSRKLHMLLEDYHSAFSLEEGERGETDLVEMEICTGDASPRRVAARRMPLAVRQEVSRQLQKMQDEAIIQPSNSPWASPIVMVREMDPIVSVLTIGS